MPRGRVQVLRGGVGGKPKCDFCVLSGPAAAGHRFMSILTHPNRWEPLVYAGGAPVKKVNNPVTPKRATSL